MLQKDIPKVKELLGHFDFRGGLDRPHFMLINKIRPWGREYVIDDGTSSSDLKE